ncbi:MAG: hypothetical protein JKX97_09370, partial [Candidatus Lindowbacteria bacterium]|nr:hypothetical protein [Candidatus Lindowbacteria bacterium]
MNARLLKRTFCLCLVLVVTTTGCFSAFDRFRRSDNWESVTFLSDEVKELVFAKDVALMTTNQGFFYSTDFTHFKRSGVMLPRGSSVVSFGMADNINDIYAVTEKGYLLRSTDRGASYKMIGEFPSIQIYDVALTTDELLFVATSSGLLVADLDLSKVSDKNERKHFMPWEMLVMALPIWRRANLGSDSDPWHDWSVVLPGNSHRIASDPRDPNHLYAEV